MFAHLGDCLLYAISFKISEAAVLILAIFLPRLSRALILAKMGWATVWAIWGRCYDHNFLRFFPIFGEIIGVFLKYQC
jgi:hypothetical protein